MWNYEISGLLNNIYGIKQYGKTAINVSIYDSEGKDISYFVILQIWNETEV